MQKCKKKGLTPLLLNYYQPWETDVTNQLKSSRVPTDPRYQGLTCDPLFQQSDHDPATYAGALVVFLGSAAVSWSILPNRATKCIRFYLA